MQIYNLVGFAIIACSLIILLRKHRPEFALMISILSAAFILISIVGQTSDIINNLYEISDDYGVSADNIKLLIKAIGICYISQLASDTCKDSGETALAQKIELAAKISIVALSLPLVIQLLSVVGDILS